jgi:hypothetical protein
MKCYEVRGLALGGSCCTWRYVLVLDVHNVSPLIVPLLQCMRE